MGYGAYNSNAGNQVPEPPKNSGNQQNKALGVILCGVIGLAAFGMMRADNKPDPTKEVVKPPAKHLTLLEKLRALEEPKGHSIKRKTVEITYKSVTSPAGLSSEALKKIALDQIEAAYKPALTTDEFAQTFEAKYTWDDYKQIFDKDWLAGVYAAAMRASDDKVADLKSDAERTDAERAAEQRNSEEERAAPRAIHKSNQPPPTPKTTKKDGGSTNMGTHKLGLDQ